MTDGPDCFVYIVRSDGVREIRYQVHTFIDAIHAIKALNVLGHKHTGTISYRYQD